jgi:hypothetical protein
MEEPEQNIARISLPEPVISPDAGASGRSAVPVLAASDVSIYYDSIQAVADGLDAWGCPPPGHVTSLPELVI